MRNKILTTIINTYFCLFVDGASDILLHPNAESYTFPNNSIMVNMHSIVNLPTMKKACSIQSKKDSLINTMIHKL
jgi:hypothetical protein